MENIIKYIVECDRPYGIIGLLAFLICSYLIILCISSFTYKIVCKVCNTIKTYKNAHTKVESEKTSFEINLHQ